ncbi:hypothetical protein [Azospirillum halopraeferens]|uniref:hypothetical protein n=1 Tax=Azospirillum halopraeferens TaxID=34010 RepID=UPI0004291C95|nr:hypothetical protein [Azospirillum halopraeferens]
MARKTIVALYDSALDADAARTRLRDAGIPDDDIEVHSHSGYGAGNGGGEIIPNLTGWGVPQDEAFVYAEGLREGGTLLVVSLLKDDSVERAIGLLGSVPVEPAMAAETPAVTPQPQPAGHDTRPVPDVPPPATPVSATDSTAAGRRTARSVESEQTLSDAARALRDTNAAAKAKGAGAKGAGAKVKPGEYVDRPGPTEPPR